MSIQYDEATSHAFHNQQLQQRYEEENMEPNRLETYSDVTKIAGEIARQQQTPELNKAFAKARAEMKNPELDSVNPHFKSKFSSLTAVINATVPVLAKHGIAVLQDISEATAGIYCHTTLLHESGEERTSKPFFVPVGKNDAQGIVSATTYGRRVQLATVCGVAGESDDDGNQASKPAVQTISEKQAADLEALIDEVEANRPAFLTACGVKHLDDLPQSKLAGAVARLEKKRKAG